MNGNQFWKARAKHGRDKIFSTPELMFDAACEYFEWVDANPLTEQKVFHTNGEITKADARLMRAMTITGLCIFLGVNANYFTDFKDRLDLKSDEGKGFSRVINLIYDIVKTQKFEGASAGLLNSNIIARDLGLTDNVSNEHSGPNGEPIKVATTFNFIPVGKDD